MVDTGILSNNMKFPSHKCYMTFCDLTIYNDIPLLIRLWTIEVSIEHLRRVWHADRGRLLLRTLGPVPLGLAYVLLVETNPFPVLVVIFTDYALRISLGTFSILLIIALMFVAHMTLRFMFLMLICTISCHIICIMIWVFFLVQNRIYASCVWSVFSRYAKR